MVKVSQRFDNPPVLHMLGLGVWQGCEYVTKGSGYSSEYSFRSLQKQLSHLLSFMFLLPRFIDI